MTNYLVNTAATHPAGCTPANVAPSSAVSRTLTNKRHLGIVAAGLLLAIGGTTLWSVNAIGMAGIHVAQPSVQLAGVVTSIEGQGEPHVRALSGPMVPLEPASTVSQRNAVRAAEAYLDFTAFSQQGLIEQLEYDDFSTADATFAVDHITVDWNEQAAKAAENYLDFSAFSRGGLIDQLEYDGFTPAQAAYGVSAAGL